LQAKAPRELARENTRHDIGAATGTDGTTIFTT
jgi:hypothetical protein